MFGFFGIFIGPLIASLFISIWELYGVEFAAVLPNVDSVFDGFVDSPTQPDPDADTPADSSNDAAAP